MKKKLLALVCALALTVSLVGCALSTPDTVGKIGDFEVTSGLYLLRSTMPTSRLHSWRTLSRTPAR